MLIKLSTLSLLIFAAPAIAQDCLNYWIPPRSTAIQCLEFNRTAANIPVPATMSEPVLQFSNVKVGQRFIEGEIYNASQEPGDFRATGIAYLLMRRDERLARGYILGVTRSLAPGQSTTFKTELPRKLEQLPRGIGIRLVLIVGGQEIEIKPDYSSELN